MYFVDLFLKRSIKRKMNKAVTKEIKGIYNGPILPVTIRIAAPMLIGSLVQMFYAVIDTFFISRIDPASTSLLSGTGLMFPVFFFFMTIGQSIAVGVGALTGRMIGEGRVNETRSIMESGFLIAFLIALPLFVLGHIYTRDLIQLLSGKGIGKEAGEVAFTFFRSLLPGLILMLFSHVFIGILQGEGKTGIIAKSLIISTLLNTLLDPLLIFWAKMGVSGAGTATTISIAVSAVYITAVFIRKQSVIPLAYNIFEASKKVVIEIINTAFPNFISMAALNVSFLILNKLVCSLDEASMNAWSLVGRMDQIAFIPSFAIAGATITMISQNYGRNQLERVRQIYKTNILLGISAVAVVVLGYNLAAPFFFRLFTSVNEVLALAVTQVHVLAFTYTGVSVAIISTASFQATGKPIPAMVITLIRMGLIAIPLALLLTVYFNMEMKGVWTGLGLGNLFCLPFAWIWTSRHLRQLEFRTVIAD